MPIIRISGDYAQRRVGNQPSLHERLKCKSAARQCSRDYFGLAMGKRDEKYLSFVGGGLGVSAGYPIARLE